MAALTVQNITETGAAVNYASAAGGGDTAENGGSMFLHIKNGSGSEMTVTITAQTTSVDSSAYGDLTKANATLAIAGAAEGIIGPFPTLAYNNADQNVAITYSSATSITIAAFTITTTI